MFDYPMHIGNMIHLVAMIALLWHILYTRKCSGVSAKTQFLLALVYTTRYLDLFTIYISLYNSVAKVLFSFITYGTLLSMFGFFRKSYERKYDTYRIETLLIPCLVLALFLNGKFTVEEVSWAFSEYLEAVSLLPQFVFIENAGRAHKMMLGYIAAHTVYRCLYIVHYILRYSEEGYYSKITAATGIIHVLLCLDFFVRVGSKLEPVFDEDRQSKIATVQSDFAKLEAQHPEKDSTLKENSGYLSGNMCNVLLDPISLFGKDSDKAKLLKNGENNLLEEASSVNQI